MCLVIVHDADDEEYEIHNENFNALLLFFVFEKLSSNNSAQSIFDATDQDQSLPISSSEQGRVLWTRTITINKITGLYSKKLIVVQNYQTFDVLNALDGSLLRSIACPFHTKFTPILGSLCAMLDGEDGKVGLLICALAIFINRHPVLPMNKLKTTM
ncbi:hypothetical protein BDF19DRAFT_487954 [Syncephalis fuscata]|nr:hypothetical protein BDF19DRAFT_487954 [Syncephalis fuscata]